MSDLYQLRKDVDELYSTIIVNGKLQVVSSEEFEEFKKSLSNYADLSDVSIASNKLDNDLTILDTQLDNLTANLIEFNSALIDFDEDNSNLDNDLTKLKDNLIAFLDVLGLLDVDLNELSSSLSNLDNEMNGQNGFLTYIQELQNQIYGEGDTDNQGNPYTNNNPSPSSLKGMLDDFSVQLGNLSSSDDKLALSLAGLSGYLSTFKGTLSEFQNQIIADKGQAYYEGLDEEVVKLIGAITSANNDIEEHQDLIDETNSKIGNSNDTTNATLYGKLNNTSTTASQASSKATQVENTITNTVTPNLNQVMNMDIPAVKNKMGFNNIPNNQTLQGQINTTNEVIGGDNDSESDGTVFGLINKSLDDIDTVHTNIGNMKDLTGSLVSNIKTTQENIDDVQNDLSDVQDAVGTVNSSKDGDLQSQIMWIVENLYNLCFACPVVETENDKLSINPRIYHVCYVKSTGKYYRYTGEDILGGGS